MATQDRAFNLAAVAAPNWGDGQLALELRAGSVEAFNQLISLYQAPLYRFVSRIAGDADAADIVQEVFIKVFRSAAGFEGKSSVKTWLYQIAIHEASNHRRWWRRHKSRETSIEEPAAPHSAPDASRSPLRWADRLADAGESPLHQTLRHEQRQQLQQALTQISEPYRTAVVLREVEGLTYDEIASVLQVRVGTVKSRLLRGREMLRQRWLQMSISGWQGARVPAPLPPGPAVVPGPAPENESGPS